MTVTAGVLAQSDQTINGCVAKKQGDLRIVNDPNRCKNTEKAISWNKAGPTGPEGKPGEQEEPGATGPAGSQFRVVDSEGREES